MSECKRCGRCCQNVGTIWAHSEHPLIWAVGAAVNRRVPGLFRDHGPCDMLVIEESGRAVCLIQKWLGHKAKPKCCRDYPFDGEPCFFTTKDTKDTK